MKIFLTLLSILSFVFVALCVYSAWVIKELDKVCDLDEYEDEGVV